MKFKVDRELRVPLGLQIKGLIEYGIACGELVVGEPLPSVRDMAETVGVSPMTVSLVYRDLKKAGLIETKPGAGTRVADSSQARMAAQPSVVSLHRRIDELVDYALGMGIHTSDLGALINARLRYRLSAGHRISLVMVGLFQEATESYAKFVAAQVGRGVTVEPMTVDDIQRIPEMRHRAGSADLALTFANTHRQVSELLPNTEVVSIRFIPSEATRLDLASLDPMARVLVVSRFPDFLPILKSGVQRFAAHVQNILAIRLDDATLGEALRKADVIVYSTGAEQARDAAEPGTQAIEYRHTPDPGDIERLVISFVDKTMQTAGAPSQPDGVSFQRKQAS